MLTKKLSQFYSNSEENKEKLTKRLKRRRAKRKRLGRILGILLILAGLGLILYPFSTSLLNLRTQAKLEKEWKKIKSEAVENRSPSGQKKSLEAKPLGAPAVKIIIPKINLEAIVVEGADRNSLKKGPGHVKSSAYPGEKGYCIIAGHRTTYGAPFFRIHHLQKGDEIFIETPSSKFTYIVEKVFSTRPYDLSFMKPIDEAVLILSACTPIHSAARRLVVLAKLAT